jgi:hypothetical protein
VKFSPDTKSLKYLGFLFNSSTVSKQKTFPDGLIATIFVKSVNTLNDTGSIYSPLSFLAKFNLINSVIFKGYPEIGFVLYFLIKGIMLIISKIVPSIVQTGFSKGNIESPQQLNGNLAIGMCSTSFFPHQSDLYIYYIYRFTSSQNK